MNKEVKIEEAVRLIPDNATIMMGGFGLCGIPENLVRELARQGQKNITIISNNAGFENYGIGILIKNNQVRKMISSYIGENEELVRRFLKGEIEVELVPQGTLAERIRTAGAGIGGFYTPTGVGTLIEKGKEKKIINGKEYILEYPLSADFAFVKAYQGDYAGNLIYRKTARNFNPMMATAARVTIAEVEELLPVGSLNPDAVVTPGIYVKMIVKGEFYEKRIAKRIDR